MIKALKYTSIILAAWFIIHTAIIVTDGLCDEKVKSKVAVIFGNKVNEDGSLSERLLKRLDKGVELFHDSLAETLVVSGGLGKEGFYEGTKMAEYLVSRGIQASCIIIDDAGNTTHDTTVNVAGMQTISKKDTVTLVSQYHHISRARLSFKNSGFENIYGVHADYFEVRDVYSVIREFVGYYKYLALKE